MTDPIRKLAREIAGIKREVRSLSAGPQLSFSSIENGSVDEYDEDGNLVGRTGQQHDGTHNSSSLGGPPPPFPVAPILAGHSSGVTVSWSGEWEGGRVAPMDLDRLDVVILSDPGDDPLMIKPSASIVSQGWGGASVNLLEGTYSAVLIAWTQSGSYAVSGLSNEAVVKLPSIGPSGPPTDVPVVTAAAFAIGSIRVSFPDLDPDLAATYEIAASTTSPVATDGSDTIGTTPGTTFDITNIAGMRLSTEDPTYVIVRSKNTLGFSPWSAEASATARLADNEDISADYAYIGAIETGQVDGITITGSTLQSARTGQRVVHDTSGSTWYGQGEEVFAKMDIANATAYVRGVVDATSIQSSETTLGGTTTGSASGEFVLSGGAVADPTQALDHTSVPLDKVGLYDYHAQMGASFLAPSNAVWASSRWWMARPYSTAQNKTLFLAWSADGQGYYLSRPIMKSDPQFKEPSHTALAMSASFAYMLHPKGSGWVIDRFPRSGSTISNGDCYYTLPSVPGGYQYAPTVGMAGDGDLLVAYTVNGAQTIDTLAFNDLDVCVKKYTLSKSGTSLVLTRTKTIRINQSAGDLASVTMDTTGACFDLAALTGNTGLLLSAKDGSGFGGYGLQHFTGYVPNSGGAVAVAASPNPNGWYGGGGGHAWDGTNVWQLTGDSMEKLTSSPANQDKARHAYTYYNSATGKESMMSPVFGGGSGKSSGTLYSRYVSRWSIPILPQGVTAVRIYVGSSSSRLRLERQGGGSSYYTGTSGKSLMVQANPTPLPAGNATNPPPASNTWPVGTPYRIRSNAGIDIIDGQGWIYAPTPTSNTHAANKKYVDDKMQTVSVGTISRVSPFTIDYFTMHVVGGIAVVNGQVTRSSGNENAYVTFAQVSTSSAADILSLSYAPLFFNGKTNSSGYGVKGQVIRSGNNLYFQIVMPTASSYAMDVHGSWAVGS